MAEHGSDITDWASGQTTPDRPRIQCTDTSAGNKLIQLARYIGWFGDNIERYSTVTWVCEADRQLQGNKELHSV